MDPSKILTFEFFEDDEDEEVFSFSTINKYKTDIRNLKMSVMKLKTMEKKPNFQSEGSILVYKNFKIDKRGKRL